MTDVSKGRVRFSGVVLVICAATLFMAGVLLFYVALNWIMPGWVPFNWRHTPQGPAMPIRAAMDSRVGLSGLYLVIFGIVAVLNGLWMATFGVRNWVLTMPLVLLIVIFMVVGAWATLDPNSLAHALGQLKG